jgi:hypothetical protein
MTIKRYAGDKLVGLSSDTKPTNIPDGATFYETDTLTPFLLVNGVWEDISLSGPTGYTGSQGISYSWIRVTANYTASSNDGIVADTSGGIFNITLPASPSIGDSVVIGDGNDWSVNNLTVLPSGSDTIEGATSFILDVAGVKAEFVWDGSQWQAYVNIAGSSGGTALELYAENPSSPTAPSATGTNAVAIGNGSVASGLNSFAAGFSADATNANSIAIGQNAQSTGSGSLALGRYASASSGTATAIGAGSGGQGSKAVTGAGATAIGGSYASGTDSFAAAIVNNTASYGATGTFSVAIGYLSKSTSQESLAIGPRSLATDTAANAFGYQATATGFASSAMGYSATASAFGSVAIGSNSNGTGSVSSGDGALAINGGAASGIDSVAISGFNGSGAGAIAIGTQSVAIGNSYASNTESFAVNISNNTSSYGATGSNSVAMGLDSKATGINSSALGGTLNISSGSYSVTSGSRNTASATRTIAIGGHANVASGAYAAILGGIGNIASGEFSRAGGYFADTKNIHGKDAYSSYNFANNGDAQRASLVLLCDTANSTPEDLKSNIDPVGTTNQVILPNNSAYFFSGTIVARQKASDGTDMGAWEVKGAIRREANAASTVLVSSTIDEFSAPAGWTIALSADTTNGGLAITVTGPAATNIRWVATINTSEVTYA